MFSIVIITFLVLLSSVKSDIPVHCIWPQMEGTWTFKLSENTYTKDVTNHCKFDQDLPYPVSKTMKITLKSPDIAIDEDTGKSGFFTLVYDEYLHIKLEGQSFLVFFKYKKHGYKTESYCNETFTGWFHDIKVDPDTEPLNWGCFYGAKDQSSSSDIHVYENQKKKLYIPTVEDIERINDMQEGWTAVKYPDEHYRKIFKQFVKRKPGFKRTYKYPKPPTTDVNDVPDDFDWRDVKGKNYVSPVKNQGGCGSCYAWSSTGMYEARARVQTDLDFEPTYNTEDIVSHSVYNQGCDGGFPYSVHLWGEDFTIPYSSSKASYITNVEYTGGYYGACDENSMLKEAYENGPISVAFEAMGDFMSYRGGVYCHKGDVYANGDVNWEVTNHAVLVVGWGVTSDQQKFWIVKNSWGSYWGEKGYFRICRGVDNVAIESCASSAKVVLEK